MKLSKTPLTDDQAKLIESKKLSFNQGFWLKDIKLFQLHHGEKNPLIMLCNKNASKHTTWFRATSITLVAKDYLRLDGERKVQYFYIPDLSQLKEINNTAGCEIREHTLPDGSLQITQTKVSVFKPSVKPAE